MTKNEIVGRLRDGGLDASSTNRSAAVYVADAREGRAAPGWFEYRIVCDSEATERRARAILSRWYDIETSGNVWRLRSRNRVPLMAIKRGSTPPTPPTPAVDYLYFEAAEANSTVSMMSMLSTAPDLEYSTDGTNWQEWQHTTEVTPGEEEGDPDTYTHTFDTLTLSDIGDRVYLRGDNPNGYLDFENDRISCFSMTGKIEAHGNAQSLVDGDTPTLVAKSMPFFSDFMMTQEQPSGVLVSAPSLPATTFTPFCYAFLFVGCNALETMPIIPINIDTVTSEEDIDTIFSYFLNMLYGTTFDITADGGKTLIYFPNINFPISVFDGEQYVELLDSYLFAGGYPGFGLGNTNGFDLANLHLYSDVSPFYGNINTKFLGFYKSTDENGGVVSWCVSSDDGIDVTLIDNTVEDYSTITKWQTSADGVNWTDIPDSADRFLSVHISENGDYYYKVLHS